MGFFVDPFQKPAPPLKAGRDYTPPPDEVYQPLINLHYSHSNLEGRYDPSDQLAENAPGACLSPTPGVSAE